MSIFTCQTGKYLPHCRSESCHTLMKGIKEIHPICTPREEIWQCPEKSHTHVLINLAITVLGI